MPGCWRSAATDLGDRKPKLTLSSQAERTEQGWLFGSERMGLGAGFKDAEKSETSLNTTCFWKELPCRKLTEHCDDIPHAANSVVNHTWLHR